MIRAVLFDFDGTIANTIPAIREGVNNTMRLYGYPEHTNADILSFINHGARELIRQAIPAEAAKDPTQVDRVLRDYDAQYRLAYAETREAYAGMPELIDRLHRAGFRIGVLSNKQDEFVRQLSRQVLLPGSYDSAHGVAPGEPAKPDPFLPSLIARELGVSMADCAMVGDSDVDIATARNAGMLHIGVDWGYRDRAFLASHGAVRIAHTPEEVETLIVAANAEETE